MYEKLLLGRWAGISEYFKKKILGYFDPFIYFFCNHCTGALCSSQRSFFWKTVSAVSVNSGDIWNIMERGLLRFNWFNNICLFAQCAFASEIEKINLKYYILKLNKIDSRELRSQNWIQFHFRSFHWSFFICLSILVPHSFSFCSSCIFAYLGSGVGVDSSGHMRRIWSFWTHKRVSDRNQEYPIQKNSQASEAKKKVRIFLFRVDCIWL